MFCYSPVIEQQSDLDRKGAKETGKNSCNFYTNLEDFIDFHAVGDFMLVHVRYFLHSYENDYRKEKKTVFTQVQTFDSISLTNFTGTLTEVWLTEQSLRMAAHAAASRDSLHRRQRQRYQQKVHPNP